MAFSVYVVQKLPDEEFSWADLQLLHGECNGGRVKLDSQVSRGWQLQCDRCHVLVQVAISEQGSATLMKTVTDGETRKIRAAYPDDIEIIVSRKS